MKWELHIVCVYRITEFRVIALTANELKGGQMHNEFGSKSVCFGTDLLFTTKKNRSTCTRNGIGCSGDNNKIKRTINLIATRKKYLQRYLMVLTVGVVYCFDSCALCMCVRDVLHYRCASIVLHDFSNWLNCERSRANGFVYTRKKRKKKFIHALHTSRFASQYFKRMHIFFASPLFLLNCQNERYPRSVEVVSDRTAKTLKKEKNETKTTQVTKKSTEIKYEQQK